MSKRTETIIRTLSLAVVIGTIAYLGVKDGHFFEIFLASLMGFGLGIMLDRWILRPVVDLIDDTRRT